MTASQRLENVIWLTVLLLGLPPSSWFISVSRTKHTNPHQLFLSLTFDILSHMVTVNVLEQRLWELRCDCRACGTVRFSGSGCLISARNKGCCRASLVPAPRFGCVPEGTLGSHWIPSCCVFVQAVAERCWFTSLCLAKPSNTIGEDLWDSPGEDVIYCHFSLLSCITLCCLCSSPGLYPFLMPEDLLSPLPVAGVCFGWLWGCVSTWLLTLWLCPPDVSVCPGMSWGWAVEHLVLTGVMQESWRKTVPVPARSPVLICKIPFSFFNRISQPACGWPDVNNPVLLDGPYGVCYGLEIFHQRQFQDALLCSRFGLQWVSVKQQQSNTVFCLGQTRWEQIKAFVFIMECIA